MKKIVAMSLLAGLGLAASGAFAAEQKFTASVLIGGTPVTEFNARTHNISDDAEVGTSLGWNAADVNVDTMGPMKWVIAAQYVRITHKITSRAGYVRVYTNNVDGPAGTAADPKFQDGTPDPRPATVGPITEDIMDHDLDSNPAGLLWRSGANTTPETLQVAWTIKGGKKIIGGHTNDTGLNAQDPNSTDPNSEDLTDITDNRFQWLFIKDKKTPDIDFNGDLDWVDPTEIGFRDGQPYTKAITFKGLHYGGGDAEFGADSIGDPGESFMYVEGNFGSAVPADTYLTNNLILESISS